MMMPKPRLFAEEERGKRRSKLGDPRVGLSKHVDFCALADEIDVALPRPSRAKGGRPPYPTVLMTKILILQQLYILADDAVECPLLDRGSFLQFLGLTESSTIPDAKTIWLFRDCLAIEHQGNDIRHRRARQGCSVVRFPSLLLKIVACIDCPGDRWYRCGAIVARSLARASANVLSQSADVDACENFTLVSFTLNSYCTDVLFFG